MTFPYQTHWDRTANVPRIGSRWRRVGGGRPGHAGNEVTIDEIIIVGERGGQCRVSSASPTELRRLTFNRAVDDIQDPSIPSFEPVVVARHPLGAWWDPDQDCPRAGSTWGSRRGSVVIGDTVNTHQVHAQFVDGGAYARLGFVTGKDAGIPVYQPIGDACDCACECEDCHCMFGDCACGCSPSECDECGCLCSTCRCHHTGCLTCDCDCSPDICDSCECECSECPCDEEWCSECECGEDDEPEDDDPEPFPQSVIVMQDETIAEFLARMEMADD